MRQKMLVTLAVTTGFLFTAQPVAARDYDCSDFATHRQAQRWFKRHHPNRDPSGLDADHDGIACESLP